MRTSAACAVALLLLLPAVARAGPPPADVRELAKALVEIGEERQHEAKALEPIETLLSNLIAIKLSLTDPSAKAKVTAVVHEAFAPVSVKAGDAMIDAYAANFTAQQLGEVLGFMRSPTAEVEKANLPLLKAELSAALTGLAGNPAVEAEALRVFDGASPAKRELILRILKAQDFEAHTRKGYATLGAIMKTALEQAGSKEPTPQPSSSQTTDDERAADAYVRLITAVEKRYYVNHWSEADLSVVASYLESDAGQAIQTRMPLVKRAVGKSLSDQLAIAIGSLDKSVCAAVPCTQVQRASVTDFTKSMATGISSMIGAAG
jgi:hypothetical protein